jgi:hypothetical protein
MAKNDTVRKAIATRGTTVIGMMIGRAIVAADVPRAKTSAPRRTMYLLIHLIHRSQVTPAKTPAPKATMAESGDHVGAAVVVGENARPQAEPKLGRKVRRKIVRRVEKAKGPAATIDRVIVTIATAGQDENHGAPLRARKESSRTIIPTSMILTQTTSSISARTTSLWAICRSTSKATRAIRPMAERLPVIAASRLGMKQSASSST